MLEIPKENSNSTSSHGSYGLWSAYLAGGDVVIADGYSGHQECNSIHFKNIIKIITHVWFKKQICFIKILFLLFFVATFWVFFRDDCCDNLHLDVFRVYRIVPQELSTKAPGTLFTLQAAGVMNWTVIWDGCYKRDEGGVLTQECEKNKAKYGIED